MVSSVAANESAFSRLCRRARESANRRVDLRQTVRLVGVSVTCALAIAVGYWLFRSPSVEVESMLPRVDDAAFGADDDTTLAPVLHAASVYVHVAGAVLRPGVYELQDGDRVADAIMRAGGVVDGAEPDRLNLAELVRDGQRIEVPFEGEPFVVATDTSASATGGVVNINRAEADELERLPGIGPATAMAIIEDRERNGMFASVDDLDRVTGIGPATLERLRDLVTT